MPIKSSRASSSHMSFKSKAITYKLFVLFLTKQPLHLSAIVFDIASSKSLFLIDDN